MFKRLNIYFNEMYPIIPRLFLGIIVFSEIYFIMLMNHGVTDFNISAGEFVGSFTIFSFLLLLRIADDFKDYELDSRLFPQRALPSGKVKKKDLAIFLTILVIVTVVLNVAFMNNIPYFFFLYFYGSLMSVWFFQKNKIRKSLPLALVTHNPVQLVMNVYVISFACIKYNIPFLNFTNFLVLFTLYFPALIWEVSRKIRAPKDETEYVTYSKLFGYKKAIYFVVTIILVDIITNFLLVYKLNIIALIPLALNVAWIVWKSLEFTKDPTKFKFIEKIERHTYITECTMILIVVIYLLVGRI